MKRTIAILAGCTMAIAGTAGAAPFYVADGAQNVIILIDRGSVKDLGTVKQGRAIILLSDDSAPEPVILASEVEVACAPLASRELRASRLTPDGQVLTTTESTAAMSEATEGTLPWSIATSICSGKSNIPAPKEQTFATEREGLKWSLDLLARYAKKPQP